MRPIAPLAALLIASSLLGACATRPAEPRLDPSLWVPSLDAAARRQAQTRRYAGTSESALLAAAVQVLQDQGFQITTSVAALGLVGGRKTRTLQEGMSDLGKQLLPGMGRAFLLALTFGAAGDPTQQLRVANAYRVELSILPEASVEQGHALRANFYLEYLPLTTRDPIVNPAVYQEFFALLGQALVRARPGG